MIDIYISAGHSNTRGRDRGAAGNGLIEGEETVKIRNRVIEILFAKYGIRAIKDGDNTILAESINFFRKLVKPNSLLLDIHFNAGPPTATGVETLVPNIPSDTELTLAEALSKSVSRTLGIRLRGNFKGRVGVRSEAESQHKSLGWMRLTGHTVLLEDCFISNKGDTDSYLKNFDVMCEGIADELAFAADVAPVQKVADIYVVQSGDTLWGISRATNVAVTELQRINGLTSNNLRVGQILKLK
jgi:N-acetylmuramoyl-L-alanine amidase